MQKHVRSWLILSAAFLLLLSSSTLAHSEDQKPKSLSIVHLGDSYSAGNGAGQYHGPAACRRSGRNWGALFASWANSQGIAASYQNHACSRGRIGDLFSSRTLPKQSSRGVSANSMEDAKAKLDSSDACSTQAIGDDFLSVDYHLTKNNSLWPWGKDYTYECQITIRAQADFVGPQTDLVLMTMGGNDLGFSHLMTNCFGPKIPFVMDGAHAVKCRDDIAAAKNNLPNTLNKLKENIAQLITTRMTGSTSSKVMLLSYPLLSTDQAYVLNNDGIQFDASRGIREFGQLAVTEQKRVISELEATFPGRVKFVENTPAAFAGHEPDPRVFTKNDSRWINEFLETSGDHGDGGGISGIRSGSSTDWYHPNLVGHRRIAALMQDPSNLVSARSATETTDSPTATLQGPYVGKVGENLMLDARPSFSARGRITRFEWDFDGDGTFDATTSDGRVLRTYSKQISRYVHVRVTDDSGFQATASALLDITRDGDTIPDEFDNCPEQPNPMQDDLDGNGVGDSCQDPAEWGIIAPPGSSEQPTAPPTEELPAPPLPRPPVLPTSPGLPKTGN